MKTMIDHWQCDDYVLTQKVLFPSHFAGEATVVNRVHVCMCVCVCVSWSATKGCIETVNDL